MLDYPQQRHIVFDLDPLFPSDLDLTESGTLLAKLPNLALPDALYVGQIYECVCGGTPVAILTRCVDDDAKDMRQKAMLSPGLPLEDWYSRMNRDLEIRVDLCLWCVQNLGFLLPLTDHKHATTEMVIPVQPLNRLHIS